MKSPIILIFVSLLIGGCTMTKPINYSSYQQQAVPTVHQMPGAEQNVYYGTLTFRKLFAPADARSLAMAKKEHPDKRVSIALLNKDYIRFSYTNPTKRRAIGRAQKASIPIIPKLLRIPLPAYQQAQATNTDLELNGHRSGDGLTIRVPKFKAGYDLVELDLYALQSTVLISDPHTKAIGVFDVRYPKLVVSEQATCPAVLSMKPYEVKINAYSSDAQFLNNTALVKKEINRLRSAQDPDFRIEIDQSQFSICLEVADDGERLMAL